MQSSNDLITSLKSHLATPLNPSQWRYNFNRNFGGKIQTTAVTISCKGFPPTFPVKYHTQGSRFILPGKRLGPRKVKKLAQDYTAHRCDPQLRLEPSLSDSPCAFTASHKNQIMELVPQLHCCYAERSGLSTGTFSFVDGCSIHSACRHRSP